MGFWNNVLKVGMKTARGTGHAIAATAKATGSAVLHPQRTLAGAGNAMKTAAAGGAAGYVAWEKLTTDKSVARIVSDAVIGKEATDTIAGTADDVRELKEKAGEAVEAANGVQGCRRSDQRYRKLHPQYERRKRRRYVHGLLQQYQQGERFRHEPCWSRSCRIHGIRPFRLDG